MLHKGIVLLSRTFREGLEPVGIVGDAHLLGPFLHAFSHRISDASVETGTIVHHIDHLVVDLCREVLKHLLAVEDVFAEIFGRSF